MVHLWRVVLLCVWWQCIIPLRMPVRIVCVCARHIRVLDDLIPHCTRTRVWHNPSRPSGFAMLIPGKAANSVSAVSGAGARDAIDQTQDMSYNEVMRSCQGATGSRTQRGHKGDNAREGIGETGDKGDNARYEI